jgi:hypothetical protein
MILSCLQLILPELGLISPALIHDHCMAALALLDFSVAAGWLRRVQCSLMPLKHRKATVTLTKKPAPGMLDHAGRQGLCRDSCISFKEQKLESARTSSGVATNLAANGKARSKLYPLSAAESCTLRRRASSRQ